MVFNNSGFCFYFLILFYFCSSVFKQTGEERAGLDGRLRPGWCFTRAEQDPVLLGRPVPFCQAIHCLPLPRKPGIFSKSVSWNKIKCELLSWCMGHRWEARGSRVPL